MSSADGVCYKIIAYDSTDKVSKDAKRQGPDQTARVIWSGSTLFRVKLEAFLNILTDEKSRRLLLWLAL